MFERFSGRDAEKTNTKTGSFSGVQTFVPSLNEFH